MQHSSVGHVTVPLRGRCVGLTSVKPHARYADDVCGIGRSGNMCGQLVSWGCGGCGLRSE